MHIRPPVFGAALIAAFVIPVLWATAGSASPSSAPAFVQYDDEATPVPVMVPELREDHPRNAGVIEGRVTSVDYQRGVIGLDTPRHGHVEVVVLPSTNIQGRGESFHTIADISRGSRLRVFLSERAGQFIAQLIHLLKPRN